MPVELLVMVLLPFRRSVLNAGNRRDLGVELPEPFFGGSGEPVVEDGQISLRGMYFLPAAQPPSK
jgi:hypothetical protein